MGYISPRAWERRSLQEAVVFSVWKITKDQLKLLTIPAPLLKAYTTTFSHGCMRASTPSGVLPSGREKNSGQWVFFWEAKRTNEWPSYIILNQELLQYMKVQKRSQEWAFLFWNEEVSGVMLFIVQNWSVCLFVLWHQNLFLRDLSWNFISIKL